MNEVIEKILKQLHEGTGDKHDAYYTEGSHVVFVKEGQPEDDVMLSIPEMTLQHMKETGRNITINFN